MHMHVLAVPHTSYACVHFDGNWPDCTRARQELLHVNTCMCAACEQISSERLHAYGLQALVLYFICIICQLITIQAQKINTYYKERQP